MKSSDLRTQRTSVVGVCQIGIEISEDYIKIAEKRLKEVPNPLTTYGFKV